MMVLNTAVFILVALLALLGGSGTATAQQRACDNYGTPNGTACACPPGFGGASCDLPGCGGNIFQGSSRNFAQPSSDSNGFANLTSSDCTCPSGWGGFGCNVCLSSDSCQAAFAAVGGSHSASSTSGSVASITAGFDGGDGGIGQNSTLTCSTGPRVWAAGQMSCSVINPTLQGVFPGSTNLNILRSLQPALTPIANITGFGAVGSAYAQLWYNGVEQFYCTAGNCTQNLNDNGDSDVEYTCQNLQCTCRTNTTFCGASTKTNLQGVINTLSGTLTISCSSSSNSSSPNSTCSFQQSILNSLFGQNGLQLSDCTFGECVAQSVIDTTSSSSSSSSTENTHKSLSGGVIAGLAVVGGLLATALAFLALGLRSQRRAAQTPSQNGVSTVTDASSSVAVVWNDVSYIVSSPSSIDIFGSLLRRRRRNRNGESETEIENAHVSGYTEDIVVLDGVGGTVAPGEMMAILGPSGAGKTTLVEILAGKQKSGVVSGSVSFSSSTSSPSPPRQSQLPRIAFVPQQDVLPPTLTVREALKFAADLRLPESVDTSARHARVEQLIARLGLSRVADTRIGSGTQRGISGGEMRRVSIGLELVGYPDVLILDEPTSGLDSVSAARIASVLDNVAHDPARPAAVVASIHQPSSRLYFAFDRLTLLAHGRALYSGPGGSVPLTYLTERGIEPPPEGYNIADHLLDVASDPAPALFSFAPHAIPSAVRGNVAEKSEIFTESGKSAGGNEDRGPLGVSEIERGGANIGRDESPPAYTYTHKTGLWSPHWWKQTHSQYATTFLTQFEVLAGREWKILRRDKTLFITHVGVACVLGVFCGGLYFKTDDTIAGFQSRVGCLFFLGALIAFSSLSALYNVVESRALFLRERSNNYYSPTAWLLSRVVFDVVPLRIIPTIIVSSITYWMAGLAHDAAHFFKFLFILVLYSLAMTLFNFLLACFFQNGGVAILLSALSALYQMTFAGFFVHLLDIPPVLRWLQWLCPLKYTLEALSINEVGSGLMIQDTLQGVPVDVSASLIMQLLFGFGVNNYYRDVLVLFAFIAGFGAGVIGIVWFKVRERR